MTRSAPAPHEVTQLLIDWSNGTQDAGDAGLDLGDHAPGRCFLWVLIRDLSRVSQGLVGVALAEIAFGVAHRLAGLAQLIHLVAALAFSGANAQQVTVKVGVLSDMSSLYSDIGGAGSVAAAKLAIADFTKANPNVKVELISGDHQNKPDIGSQLANQWDDGDKVDLIIGGYGTNMLAPAMPIVMQRKKAFLGLYGLGVNTDFTPALPTALMKPLSGSGPS